MALPHPRPDFIYLLPITGEVSYNVESVTRLPPMCEELSLILWFATDL